VKGLVGFIRPGEYRRALAALDYDLPYTVRVGGRKPNVVCPSTLSGTNVESCRFIDRCSADAEQSAKIQEGVDSNPFSHRERIYVPRTMNGRRARQAKNWAWAGSVVLADNTTPLRKVGGGWTVTRSSKVHAVKRKRVRSDGADERVPVCGKGL
jgi:hypothetical protein